MLKETEVESEREGRLCCFCFHMDDVVAALAVLPSQRNCWSDTEEPTVGTTNNADTVSGAVESGRVRSGQEDGIDLSARFG